MNDVVAVIEFDNHNASAIIKTVNVVIADNGITSLITSISF